MNSVWEDCTHRIETLNILLHTVAELEGNIKTVKAYVDLEKYGSANEVLYKLLNSLLDTLSHFPKSSCSHQNTNTLDKKMALFRIHKINVMLERINVLKQKLLEKSPLDSRNDLCDTIAETEECLAQIRGLCFEVMNCLSSK